MYLDYWGFKRFPFENVPDPDFMYYSPEHKEAMARLQYVVKGNKGIILVTGDIGSGKTTLSRVLIDQVTRSEFDIGLMTNSILEPMDFLREILYNLGISPDKDLHKSDFLNILNERMLENLRGNRTTLLIFDEAHLLPGKTLEEIRLLLNFQLNDKFMLTIILLGQPELRSIIKGMKQLDQRIAIRYHLNPLNYNETLRYMGFRFKKGGLTRNIITRPAAEEIYSYSKGIPRMINNICDTSLMVGFISKAKAVDSKVVKNAIQDSE
ncbi:MAG: AAA family ATPase [Thermodesulfobacteriota bacterium]|nr:AAA family ATPase [Thermodesulfobacteriota bacterium]